MFPKEKDFEGGAEQTLHALLNEVLPRLKKNGSLREDAGFIIGGYSLAGLFALWACRECTAFSAAASASPSVWFPGWDDYADAAPFLAKAAALSLGNREHRTRNAALARSAECIVREKERIIRQKAACSLVWNKGGHFSEPDRRTTDVFLTAARLLK